MSTKHRGMRIEYAAPPRPGTDVEHRGHTYSVEAVKPYTRKDGTDSGIITWSSICARCWARFTFTTGLAGYLDLTCCVSCRDDNRLKRLALLRERKGQLARGEPLSRYPRKASF